MEVKISRPSGSIWRDDIISKINTQNLENKITKSTNTMATIVEPIKNFAHISHGIAEATSEFLEDSTLGSPLPNYAHDEKKADEDKAHLADKMYCKIAAAPGEIVARVAEGTADLSKTPPSASLGQPKPNHACNEKKVEQDM